MRNNKNKTKIFEPLIESSDMKRHNFLILFLLYAAIVALLYKFKLFFYIGLVLAIPVLVFLFFQQKIYKKNLDVWKVSDKTPKALIFNLIGDVIIDIGGVEIPLKSIEKLKISYNEPPKMESFTKYFILLYFINCTLEIHITGGKVVTMPLHSRSEIKKIVNILVDLDVQASFDQHVYRLCGLN